ncbi:MAG: hypothetical protein NC131_22230 [Roseburia sp.]|nr:hypothetical protein [Roseburia sp.]
MRLQLVLFVFLFFGNLVAGAQAQRQTEYFRLIKKIGIDGAATPYAEQAGQFITRIDGLCFDSDINGRNAGNGILNMYDRRGSQSVYAGSSFWGPDSRYRFDDSRGMLNVKTAEGEVYVFRRETPPAGCNWPSFLSDPGFLDGTYQAMVDQANAETQAMIAASSHYNEAPTHNCTHHGSSISSRPNRCPSCLGRGYCSLCSGRGYYQPSHTSNHRTRCPKCHTSGRCSLCHGTGYYGRTVWYNRR